MRISAEREKTIDIGFQNEQKQGMRRAVECGPRRPRLVNDHLKIRRCNAGSTGTVRVYHETTLAAAARGEGQPPSDGEMALVDCATPPFAASAGKPPFSNVLSAVRPGVDGMCRHGRRGKSECRSGVPAVDGGNARLNGFPRRGFFTRRALPPRKSSPARRSGSLRAGRNRTGGAPCRDAICECGHPACA